MRKQITLYDDQYQFYKELKSKRLLVAFVEYMFEDIEPEWLNWIEKVAFNSLRIRMQNQMKKSYAWTQSHWWWRPRNTSSELSSENNTNNNTKTTQQTSDKTTEKQEVEVKEEVIKENKKRKGYWEFGMCYLTDEEHEQVLKEYWTRNGELLISQVDNYCASKWKKYKNYVATIRNFAKNWWITKLQVKDENETGIYDLPF